MNNFKNISFFLIFALILLLPLACNEDKPNQNANAETSESSNYKGSRFRLLSPTESGIRFSNELKEDYTYNILNFEYLYNGGGVAIGDINNDDLPDIYFTATFGSNKLYLNKGNLKFEDITDKAGVSAKSGFKTGVTMADVNGDGFLDIFVCKTSKSDDGQKNNLLFINNGNLTFTESALKYGLEDNSNSNHANFFDYDLDGDLDMYLLNHRLGFKDAVRLRLSQQPGGKLVRLTNPLTPFESDRLYRNDGNGRFTDVSLQAGIVNSAFGLSASISDINDDGFPDVFVANDYIEPDNVYINNGDGTFTDHYSDYLRHSSQNSMGSDIADFNNDGLLDIIVLDMIANDPVRYKQLMNVMILERYETLVKYGYGHQVARNNLQLNNGNGTFSEVGQLSGISNTDWSWGAFFADFDNDGFKDIYIGNGYKRDVTDLDYMVYTRDSIERTGGVKKSRFPDINTFLDLIPSTKLQNYLFRNNGNLTFENVSNSWGLTEKTFSNGTAFGDLDGDGDLDLVVNNIGDPAFVYENKTNELPNHNYLQVKLQGSKLNSNGIGTKVTLHQSDGTIQHQELTANRGFFSSSELLLHFGLNDQNKVESIEIKWPDGKTQTLKNVNANQKLVIKHSKASSKNIVDSGTNKVIFKALSDQLGVNFRHVENEFQDFNRERLIPYKFSRLGPHIASGDVNGDGFEDFYIGGAMGTAGALFIQNKTGKFSKTSASTWEADKSHEDMDCVFFDADGDADLDLYIVSGGNERKANDSAYQDRLYFNDGKGNFSKTANLPIITSSGSCVNAFDFDGDGDLDIFVGGRVTPGLFPMIPDSYVLKNEGGQFINVTDQVAPDFKNIGMVTDILWADVDGDSKAELIAVGEWMPVSIFKYDGKQFNDITKNSGLENTNGWWNCLAVDDFDNDGDQDIVVGNLGKNTRLKASEDNPLRIFAKDYDDNGSIDPIMTFSKNGKDYPFPGRDALVKQVSKVKKKFPTYAKYASATFEEVFSEEELKAAMKLETKLLSSTYFENLGDGTFKAIELPNEVQMAPVTNILISDVNDDGKSDIIMVGNNSGAETETGVYDAFNGVILLGDGKGNFTVSKNIENGFWANNEARDIKKIQLADGRQLILVANNNDELQFFVKDKTIN
jgi:enediyne biosynthesis protein E4